MPRDWRPKAMSSQRAAPRVDPRLNTRPVGRGVRDESLSGRDLALPRRGHRVASDSRVNAAWAATGALAVVLFGCGLLFADLLGTTHYPALNASSLQLRQYFTRNVSEVRALSFFHLLAAVALAAFASYLYSTLRAAG